MVSPESGVPGIQSSGPSRVSGAAAGDGGRSSSERIPALVFREQSRKTEWSLCFRHVPYPGTGGRVSFSQSLAQVQLQDVELPGDEPAVAAGAGQHDRAFDDAHDVVGQFRHSGTFLAAAGPRGGTEVRLELLGHLVEALVEAAAEAIMRVTQRCAEVPDDAAASCVLAAAHHHCDRIQATEHRRKWPRIARLGKRLLDPVEQLAAPSICRSITAKARSSLPLK